MLIVGRNPVLEALKSGRTIAKIYFRFGIHGEAIGDIQRRAREHGIPVTVLPKQKFDRFGAEAPSQGIVALIEDVDVLSIDDLLAITREQDPPFFAALDSINDPRNLGAILRAAECAGVHGALLPARDAAVLSDIVVKTSAGATSHLPLARVTNLRQGLDRMKEEGLWIAGLDADGDVDLFALDGLRPICLVVGSEGKGLRPTIRQACDMLVRIPMWGQVSSLNASVAAALAFYEIRRRRV
jgi:23S rRNA (guanosine2251-2'-O)-methyltransferase